MRTNNMKQFSKRNSIIGAVVGTALISVASTGVVLYVNKQDDPRPPGSSSQNQSSKMTYKNGTYVALGTYPTGGGRESIDLTITIRDAVITNTDVFQNAISPEAKDYQGRFVSAYKQLVVGKRIDEVSLSRVAGSSLTSIGFNKAITQIKSDASQ